MTAWCTRCRRRATPRPTSRAWAWPPESSSTAKTISFVGDRSGTVFKISRQRQIYVFATLEPSIAAYHLAFGPDGYLYVTGPTTSSFDAVHRIDKDGHVETYYRGLGRPQGMAFDVKGNLYVAASLGGRRGVVRISPDRNAELFLSGPAIVGPGVFAVEIGDRGHQQLAVQGGRASKAGRSPKVPPKF